MRRVPDNLEAFARRASDAFLSGSKPSLTEALTETVKDAGLNSRQVQLVTHGANRFTWQSVFRTADDKTVQFDPADPTDVLKETSMDTASPVHLPPGPVEVHEPQARVPLYSGPGVTEQFLNGANEAVAIYETAKVAHVQARGAALGARTALLEGLAKFAEEVSAGLFRREFELNDVVLAIAVKAPGATGELLAKTALEAAAEVGIGREGLGHVPSDFEVDEGHPLADLIGKCVGAVHDYATASDTADFNQALSRGAFARIGL